MKKILCYLGIIFLFILTFLPPLLRFTLKDKDLKEEDEIIKNISLVCSSPYYVTNTNYQDNKINMLVIKKMKVERDRIELDDIFTSLVKSNNAIYKELEDGEVISLDFSIYTHEKLNIDSLTKDVLSQKEYYEQLGLTCLTRE